LPDKEGGGHPQRHDDNRDYCGLRYDHATKSKTWHPKHVLCAMANVAYTQTNNAPFQVDFRTWGGRSFLEIEGKKGGSFEPHPAGAQNDLYA
jgi:hypothetical protein